MDGEYPIHSSTNAAQGAIVRCRVIDAGARITGGESQSILDGDRLFVQFNGSDEQTVDPGPGVEFLHLQIQRWGQQFHASSEVVGGINGIIRFHDRDSNLHRHQEAVSELNFRERL